MKKGYLLVQAHVGDSGAYEVYKQLAEQAVRLYGGRYLVRGGAIESLEGSAPSGRLVIIEFESVAQARRFYESAEYGAARETRTGIADMDMSIVEGISLAGGIG